MILSMKKNCFFFIKEGPLKQQLIIGKRNLFGCDAIWRESQQNKSLLDILSKDIVQFLTK